MVNTIRPLVVLATIVGILLAPTALSAEREGAQDKPDAQGVNVTVKYTGKGTVDATHKLWVWLFDNPNIGPESIPIGEQAIEKNGGTARFVGVSSKAVYIAVAYDEKGGFAGQAPPPPGSPIAMHGVKADTDKPVAVTPGAKTAITITFADAQRMQ
jgi:hypothetical protein